MKLTPEQVDRLEPDTSTSDPSLGRNCPNFFRHLYFARFCLGEDWLTSFQIAAQFQRTPLTTEAMREIERDWKEENWGWAERKES